MKLKLQLIVVNAAEAIDEAVRESIPPDIRDEDFDALYAAQKERFEKALENWIHAGDLVEGEFDLHSGILAVKQNK